MLSHGKSGNYLTPLIANVFTNIFDPYVGNYCHTGPRGLIIRHRNRF